MCRIRPPESRESYSQVIDLRRFALALSGALLLALSLPLAAADRTKVIVLGFDGVDAKGQSMFDFPVHFTMRDAFATAAADRPAVAVATPPATTTSRRLAVTEEKGVFIKGSPSLSCYRNVR